jgi:hypothetical protein
MNTMRAFIGKQIEMEITGRKLPIRGFLIDIGSDIAVVHNGMQFLYVPIIHLQYMSLCQQIDSDIADPPDPPFENQTDISYRKVLMNAKGIFTELYITGNQTIHGYLTSIMNDFFVFYSPVFRSVFISMHHMKYLIPYSPNVTPYSLKQDRFPLNPSSLSLARTFEQQLKKLEGEFVILDLGENPNKIGLLRSVQNNMLELVTADGRTIFLHMEHVKTVHVP